MEKKTIKKKEEETVQLSREDYNKLMHTIEKQSSDIKLLYDASDKSRLAKANNKGGKVLIHTAKVSKWTDDSKYNGKYVIGWKLITNKSEIINGRSIEDQKTMVIFEDEKPLEVSILEFYRKTIQRDEGEIIGRSTQIVNKETGEEDEIFKLQFPNGRTLEISHKFVNI